MSEHQSGELKYNNMSSSAWPGRIVAIYPGSYGIIGVVDATSG
jgi:hypothetical protein